MEAVFKRLGVEQYFQGILTCSEYNMDKTKPDIYLEAAKQIHTKPDQTLVFEDVLHALAAMLDLGKGRGPMNHAFAIGGYFREMGKSEKNLVNQRKYNYL